MTIFSSRTIILGGCSEEISASGSSVNTIGGGGGMNCGGSFLSLLAVVADSCWETTVTGAVAIGVGGFENCFDSVIIDFAVTTVG